MIDQGLFLGRVSHHRELPRHDFRKKILMAYCDVDRLDQASDACLRLTPMLPLLVRRQDMLEAGDASLRQRVTDLVSPALGRSPSGPISLLTQPRAFGLTFNPVNFLYCFEERSGELEAVVAEVINTPWGERHAYVLTGQERDDRGQRIFRSHKQLHVSPFFEMDHDYRFEVTPPEKSARVMIENTRAGKRVFRASLDLSRISGLGSEALHAAIRHPLMPYETMVGIYFQALRLALKRTPFHTHPRRLEARALEDAR